MCINITATRRQLPSIMNGVQWVENGVRLKLLSCFRKRLTSDVEPLNGGLCDKMKIVIFIAVSWRAVVVDTAVWSVDSPSTLIRDAEPAGMYRLCKKLADDDLRTGVPRSKPMKKPRKEKRKMTMVSSAIVVLTVDIWSQITLVCEWILTVTLCTYSADTFFMLSDKYWFSSLTVDRVILYHCLQLLDCCSFTSHSESSLT